ncbi:hypothetical protein ACTXPG_10310 [Glutamicibacter arilaitensis]|uniref:hypothetical protein n=1 Tax=Glutamicibacter arilaitensis TaxID=256701 RepID=UPI003FD196DE
MLQQPPTRSTVKRATKICQLCRYVKKLLETHCRSHGIEHGWKSTGNYGACQDSDVNELHQAGKTLGDQRIGPSTAIRFIQ